MVIVNPYPGQEMRNTDNLLENGIAVKANYLLGSKLNGVASDPARLKRMQKQSRAYGNAGACFSIAEYARRVRLSSCWAREGLRERERERRGGGAFWWGRASAFSYLNVNGTFFSQRVST